MPTSITRQELKQLIDHGDVIVVETLPAMYFNQEHIPGAINIPHDDIDAQAPKLLADKDAAIVTYCANTPCKNSGVAAAKLENLGYTNVREYVEGKQDWVAAGLPTESGVITAA